MSPIRLCTNQLASNFRMWKSMRRCCKSRNQLVTEHYCRFQWTDAIWDSLPHVRRILSPARIHFTQSGPYSECRTLAMDNQKRRATSGNNQQPVTAGFLTGDLSEWIHVYAERLLLCFVSKRCHTVWCVSRGRLRRRNIVQCWQYLLLTLLCSFQFTCATQ